MNSQTMSRHLHKLVWKTPYVCLKVDHKKKTAEMYFDPARDMRIPVEMLIGTKHDMSGKRPDILAKSPKDDALWDHIRSIGLRGYKDIPLEQAEKILLDSAPFYRPRPDPLKRVQ